ncbi:hypothetical protein CPB86DRAFT_89797 [Serendipita vermifera]|nr:hypothetical protein CPB86DRAFT_89797 [Serendipita vermifera]
MGGVPRPHLQSSHQSMASTSRDGGSRYRQSGTLSSRFSSHHHAGSSSGARSSHSLSKQRGYNRNHSPDREKKERRKPIEWKFTNAPMNARDLAKDDDFVSHMLVECLGSVEPLSVHKMDASRRLPTWDPDVILDIVQKYVVQSPQSRGTVAPYTRVKPAVDALLQLHNVRKYISHKTPNQVNAFATHMCRYLELYLPSGSIEITSTSRYSHKTGKSELCVIAIRPLKPGQTIADLKGSMADLTAEEDEELKEIRGAGARRDFSVIFSHSRNVNHLFLGPARFVNHDCENNCDLIREGRYITFKVIKPIGAGEEITAHYGDDYFGKNNRRCLCASCEEKGIGGYMIESDWSLHSSESDGDETLGASNEKSKTGGLLAPPVPKKRRSELDNLKENLTDLMKAPILPLGDSDDNEPADKEKRKKKRERKEKEKEKEQSTPSKAPPDSTSKTSESPHAEGAQNVRVAQLPTPSTTHSNTSTGGSTPRQQSLGDNEDEAEDANTRAESTEFAMITPPPSNKTQSADEGEQPKKSVPHIGRVFRDENGRRYILQRGPPPNWGPRKTVPDCERRVYLSDEADEESTKDSDGSDESSSTSDQEEQRRVYAFRQRKLKETQASTTNRSSGNRGTGSAPNLTTASVATGQSSTDATKKGKVCMTCKCNELKAKNELTCGRCKRHFNIYGAQWPNRISATALIAASSREGSPPYDSMRGGLSRHYSTANGHEASKLRHRDSYSRLANGESDDNPRPFKRRKTDSGVGELSRAERMIQREREKARRVQESTTDDSSDEERPVGSMVRPAQRPRYPIPQDYLATINATEEHEVLNSLVTTNAESVTSPKRPRGRPGKYHSVSNGHAKQRSRDRIRREGSDSDSDHSRAKSQTDQPLSPLGFKKSNFPPPSPKLYGFRPSPAMFAAKKLHGPVMELRGEISDNEDMIDDKSGDSDAMSVDEGPQPPVVWMPQDSSEEESPGKYHHQYVRKPSPVTSQPRSFHSTSDEVSNAQIVQSLVARSFGLWRSGNPQSFASQKRRIDVTTEYEEEFFASIPQYPDSQDSSEEAKPPPTPANKESKYLYTPATASKLDEYQRPRNQSMGQFLLDKEKAEAMQKSRESEKRRRFLMSTQLIKQRSQFSTYTDHPRSHVKLGYEGISERRGAFSREEVTWLKARPWRASLEESFPVTESKIPPRSMHRSTLSLPLYESYDSQNEGIDMEESDGFVDINQALDLCDTNPEEDGEDIGSASWLDHSESHQHTTSHLYLKGSARTGLSNYDTQSSYASSPIKSASDVATNIGDHSQEHILELGFKLPKRQRNEVCIQSFA